MAVHLFCCLQTNTICMRIAIIGLLAGLLWSSSAGAQNRKKTSAPKPRTEKAAVRASSPVIRIHAADSNQAKAGISDPTIRAMNAPGKANTDLLGPVGIPGVPRGANGFSNGRLLLRPTSATTFGSIQGNSLVGTGSSLGTPGSNGPFMGVNGKSPYAGWSMWGNARNLPVWRGDSAVRTTRVRD